METTGAAFESESCLHEWPSFQSGLRCCQFRPSVCVQSTMEGKGFRVQGLGFRLRGKNQAPPEVKSLLLRAWGFPSSE